MAQGPGGQISSQKALPSGVKVSAQGYLLGEVSPEDREKIKAAAHDRQHPVTSPNNNLAEVFAGIISRPNLDRQNHGLPGQETKV